MTDDPLSPIDAPCCDIVKGRNIKCSMTVTKTYGRTSTVTIAEVEIVMKNDVAFCSTMALNEIRH